MIHDVCVLISTEGPRSTFNLDGLTYGIELLHFVNAAAKMHIDVEHTSELVALLALLLQVLRPRHRNLT